ncbi:Ger(x)C family spore germination protein [Paenibacillus sepulcri]|uniref:Ger(X)C family spore germination protein n=1 Tax=Paenibacillus sepulcri TaxID=359917 RepID=A0ABS7BZK6_9BACL|nr:Ger(x)C family spore germination protein [Paenibacillus sepulcri]
MNRFVFLLCVSLIFLLSSSGCTDIIEPNQLAFVMGTAIDHTDDGGIEVSHQIVIPSQKSGPFQGGSSGSSDNFIVVSATGRDVFEAFQKIQRKLSRRLMTTHRILIAISEEYFNKHDVSKLFDKLNRDPANNLRDITILIKGGRARDFLMLQPPMEHLSSIAAGKELQINGMNSYSSRQFIIDSLSEGIRPLVPILQIKNIKMGSKEPGPIAVLSGFAVLNKKLKVTGLLDDAEGSGAAWMTGKGTSQGATIPWKDGSSVLSFRLTHLKRRIQSVRGNDPTRIVLTVKAEAYLLENTTSLDMSEADNMIAVQTYVNKQLQKELQLTMDKVKQWGSDVFGIGEHLHRKSPYWWNLQKDDWDENFKKTDVTVKADIQLRSFGLSGAPLND